jgi:HNH endonuclease
MHAHRMRGPDKPGAKRPHKDQAWNWQGGLDRYVVTEGGCWFWTGPSLRGYGLCNIRYGARSSHRAMYQREIGPIPVGMHLDHLCKQTLCINPRHLEAVTPQENWRRSNSFTARMARATHCPKGHPYSGENLYVRPDGTGRGCKACHKEAPLASR